jgi:hypothetical protein
LIGEREQNRIAGLMDGSVIFLKKIATKYCVSTIVELMWVHLIKTPAPAMDRVLKMKKFATYKPTRNT